LVKPETAESRQVLAKIDPRAAMLSRIQVEREIRQLSKDQRGGLCNWFPRLWAIDRASLFSLAYEMLSKSWGSIRISDVRLCRSNFYT
jgi:hypothetical protein